MYFSEVIGQQALKDKLRRETAEGRVPHAMLFCGAPGYGTLALALAYAQYLLCPCRSAEDSCGTCPSCRQVARLEHPDLHFVFPNQKKSARTKAEDSLCAHWQAEWRDFLKGGPYVRLDSWLEAMGAKGQALIYAGEAADLVRKMNIASSAGGYKVVIIWYPERMNEACANKLLKLLEEPPGQSAFILVSEAPERLLPTIVSRTQRILVPRIGEADIAAALGSRFALDPAAAGAAAHRSGGDFIEALSALSATGEEKAWFDRFVELMRLAYTRNARGMKAWSEKLADLPREQEKAFLLYSQRMLRENFVYNFHCPQMVYMSPAEQQFAVRFAPFINERNCIGIMEELELARRHVEQNVNAKMVFFDLALQIAVLIRHR